MIDIGNLKALPGRGVVYWNGNLCHRPEKMRIEAVTRCQKFNEEGIEYNGLELLFRRNSWSHESIEPRFLFDNWTEWYRCIVDHMPWKWLTDPMRYVILVARPGKSQRVAKVVEDTGLEDLGKLTKALQKLVEDFKREDNWPNRLSPGMAMGSCLPCIVSLARRRPDIRRRDGHDMSRLWAILVDGEKE